MTASIRLLVFLAWGSVAWSQIVLSAAEEREWTDAEGRKIRASFGGFHDDRNAILHLPDGRRVTFPIEKLSPADREYVKAEQGKADGPSTIDWDQPQQSPDYVIRGVKRANVPGFISVNSGWEYKIKCVEARLEYRGEDASAPGSVRAYFYNREGVLIDQMDKAPRRQDESRKYVESPQNFAKGETVEVYFPLTEQHERGGLATVLVVFGSGGKYQVHTMPSTSLEKLAFDEKKDLFPDWKPDPGKATEGGGATAEAVEIRRLRLENHRLSMIYDGNYQTDKPCVTAEVRAAKPSGAPAGVVKLYAFDASGRQVGQRVRPSTASVGGASYVGIPQIADESWHPVFFALDGDLKEKVPTYLVVFQYGGKVAAMVDSSVGATLETLDFPEKRTLTP